MGLLLGGLLLGLSIAAEAVPESPVTLKLLSDKSAIHPGSSFKLSVRAQIAPGWHIYWTNPGETGLPTNIKWKVPEGCAVSKTYYPVPKRYVQEITKEFSMVSHTFEVEAYFTVEVKVPAAIQVGSELVVSAEIDWQACKEICTPPTTTPLTITVPVRESAVESPAAKAIASSWESGYGGVPKILVSIDQTERTFQLKGIIPPDVPPVGKDARFLPSAEGIVSASAPQELHLEGDTITLSVPLSENAVLPETLAGYLVDGGGAAIWMSTNLRGDASNNSNTVDGSSTDISPSNATGNNLEIQDQIELIRSWGLVSSDSSESVDDNSEKGLLLFMLLALAGGVILNLMPCVFPVLGIKIMGFVQQAGDDNATIRKHGWAFTFGVILSLWTLVGFLFLVRQYGESAGWGFQLQEPGFVLFMIFLMFGFALNLCGLFEFGTSLIGVGSSLQSKSGLGGAFFSGVLAVLVATPCTGPFMAPALGYALSKPFPLAILVFTMLAVGLALPYLLLSYFPFLIKKLPRPGAWMETFKQFMSFPMFATVIWLLWIFGAQTNQNALIIVLGAMLTGALGLWVYGKYTPPAVAILKKRVAQLVSAMLVVTMIVLGGIASRQKPTVVKATKVDKYGISWETFDTGRIIDLREQGKTLFIDFTANW